MCLRLFFDKSCVLIASHLVSPCLTEQVAAESLENV